MGNRADSAFARFRRRRDPSDLAEVFDLCADDLLRVAVHLCPTDGEAEDLVQETFLVAIEHAGRYRPGEPVVAWLLGILRNRAREHRKRSARHPEPDRMHSPSAARPLEMLMHGEFLEAYEAALVRIPGPYREVLDLRLRDGLRANEIAQRLERPSGTVRTQIYRALELLRAALPAGSAVALSSHTMTRGMGALRGRVVEQASVATHSTLALGGLVAMKKISLVAAVVLIALSARYAMQRTMRPDPERTAPTIDASPSSAAGAATELAAVERGRPSLREVAEDAPKARDGTPADSMGPFLVDPYRVTVQVVDTMLEPVVGATVMVHEAQLHRSETPGASGSQPGILGGTEAQGASQRSYSGRAPGVEPLWRGMTDGLGRCVLRLDREFCYVSVEHERHGLSTDEGVSSRLDGEVLRVVLEPCTRVSGVVLDSDGNGAAAAVVQAWTIGGAGETARVTAVTDLHGSYELRLVAGVIFGLRATDGRRFSDLAQVEATSRGGERTIDFQLPGAYRVTGVILDPDGSPAEEAAAHVHAAARGDFGRRVADADPERLGAGRFEVLLTRPGEYVVAAHAAGMAHSEFQRIVLDDEGPLQDVTLRLQPLSTLEGRVLDPQGAPCPGLAMRVNRQQPGVIAWEMAEEALLTRTDDRGAFRVEGVQPSSNYTFTFAPNTDHPGLLQRVRNVEGGRKDVEIRLDSALIQTASVTGRVIDGATGEPVTAFEITTRTVGERGHSSGRPLEFNAPDGRFAIEGLQQGLRYDLEVHVDGWQAVASPDWTAEGTHEVTIELPERAAIECVVWDRDGARVPEVLMSFVPLGDPTRSVRSRTNEQGAVTVSLAPGTYMVHALVSAGVRPDPLKVDVQAGERRRLDVKLD